MLREVRAPTPPSPAAGETPPPKKPLTLMTAASGVEWEGGGGGAQLTRLIESGTTTTRHSFSSNEVKFSGISGLPGREFYTNACQKQMDKLNSTVKLG